MKGTLTMMQTIEHKLAQYGHWLVLAILGAVGSLQKIQPGALNADVHNDVQMAMLVLGASTVAAILHNAWIQKAMVLAQKVADGASTVSQAAGTVASAIQGAQQQASQQPKS